MHWLSQQGLFPVGLEKSFCQPPRHEVRPDCRARWSEGRAKADVCVQRGQVHSRLE